MAKKKHTTESLKKASLIELADFIIQDMPQLAIQNNDLYSYNGKYYEAMSDQEAGQQVFDFFLEYGASVWSPTKSKNIIEALKHHPTIKRVEEFDGYDDLINVSNGVYDFTNKTLSPHSPDYHFTTIIDVDYDPEQTDASYFLDVLSGIFRNPDGTDDEVTIGNILKIGGYLLYPQNTIAKLFIFYGEGSNGKSIIMDHVYKMFFDRKFLSSLSLNVLSSETSASRKQLLTSRINFATEQKGGDIESDEIKKIVSGEDISIRRMYQDTVTHRPKTKILVALNKMAKFKDTSYGIKRRLFIVNFPNQFKVQSEYEQEVNPTKRRIFPARNQEEVISNLKREKTAIFNLFLQALEVLRNDNWQLTTGENTEKVMKEYNEESDPAGEWLKDTFEIDESDNNITSLNEIYSKYIEWHDETSPSRQYMITRRTLAKKIRDLFRVDSFRHSWRDHQGEVRTSTAFSLKYKINKLTQWATQPQQQQDNNTNTPTQDEINF